MSIEMSSKTVSFNNISYSLNQELEEQFNLNNHSSLRNALEFQLIEDSRTYMPASKAIKYIEPNDSVANKLKAYLANEVVEESLKLQTYYSPKFIENNLPLIFNQTVADDPFIKIPVKGLDKIARYYERKYNIIIRFCFRDQLLHVLEMLAKSPPESSFGIIVFTEDFEHQTPLLVYAHENQLKILVMDTSPLPHIIEPLFNILNASQVPYKYGTELRQASYHSCDIEAIVLLRNTLLYLRLRGKSSQDVDSLVTSFGDNVVLPSEWTYIDEIHRNQIEGIVVRDLFSKKITNNNPRSTKNFREHYEKEVTIACQLQQTRFFPSNYHNVAFEYAQQNGLEEYVSTDVGLNWKVTRNVNCYLKAKGFKMADKLRVIEDGK